MVIVAEVSGHISVTFHQEYLTGVHKIHCTISQTLRTDPELLAADEACHLGGNLDFYICKLPLLGNDEDEEEEDAQCV